MTTVTIHHIVAYLFYAVLLWVISWSVIYKLSGVFVGSISINNGILFNNIALHRRKYKLLFDSVRFRLWGNSKKLIVNGLKLTMKDDGSKKVSKTKSKSANPVYDNGFLCIYPKSSVKKWLVRLFIQMVPGFSTEFKNTSIVVNDRITKIPFLTFGMSTKYSKKNNNHLKYNYSFVANHSENYSVEHNNNKFPLISIGSIKIEYKFAVDLKSGVISNIHLKTFTDDFRLLVFKLVKLYLPEIEAFFDKLHKKEKSETPVSSEGLDEREQKVNNFLKILYSIYNSVEEISILNENISILEIPFITTSFNKSFKDYLAMEYPTTSLEMLVKSTNFLVNKLSKNSAGFHALFESLNDSPINTSSSVQSLTLNFATLVESEGHFITKKLVEVLNAPNFSTIFKGNFIDKVSRGEGFKDCIAEAFVSCSNPILDLTSNFISHALYNFIILQKFLKLKKAHAKYRKLIIRYDQDDITETLRSSGSSSDLDSDVDVTLNDNQQPKKPLSEGPLKRKLWKYFLDFYPRLDVKFIVEQPKLIVRHVNKQSSAIELLSYQYSSLYLQLSTTEERDYLLDCRVLAPMVSYIQKSKKTPNKVHKFNLISLNSVSVIINVLKNFKFKSDVKFDSLTLDLSNLKSLVGMNHIIISLTDLIKQDLNNGHINNMLNTTLAKYQKVFSKIERHYQTQSELPASKFFKHLPEWFIHFDVEFKTPCFLLGSRSVLIPADLLTVLANKDQNWLDFIKLDDSDELRCLRVKLDNLTFSLKNDSVDSDLVSTPHSGSLETLTSVTDTNYWSSGINVRNLNVSAMTDFHAADNFETLLEIPEITLDNESFKNNARNQLKSKINVSQITGEFDYMKVFTIISVLSLLRNTVLNPIKATIRNLKKDVEKLHTRTVSVNSHKLLIDFLSVSIKVKKTDFSVILHNNYRLKLDSFQTKVNLSDNEITIRDKFFRLLTESPTLEGSWCRLCCIDDFEFRMHLHNLKNVSVDSTSIRLIHPNRHVVYRVFDSISVSVKVLKHLFKSLKHQDEINDLTVVHPSESTAKEAPDIHFKSKRLVFNMEDDPFESELGMIFQLGMVEQRKRMELHSLFDAKLEIVNKSPRIIEPEDDSNEEEIPDKLEELNEIISYSWINKVKRYKRVLNDELVQNKRFLFGNEAKLDPKFQENIQPYSIHAPLLSIIMENLRLTVSKPKFHLSELPDFMYKIGQGLPKDTRYSLILPTFMDLRVDELRMHLRDYPLPMLFVPNTNPSASAVTMSGHLIIAESLVFDDENLRELNVDLVKNLKQDSKFSKYYRLCIQKTLASVKMYTDIAVDFKSKLPARFVWGQSYQFALQQAMLNFDQFSKPPVDPSPKLGFWDKLRYILHGNFTIRCLQGPLEVAFKGSRDPYNLIGDASGFVLAFEEDVIWTINKTDNSREFCNVKANKVSWSILNYLASGLTCWLRDSSKLTYLPDSKKFVTSCYAYYLEDDDYALPKQKVSNQVLDKKVVSLSGGVDFKVGFVLQRDDENGNKTEDCISHYDIKLYNPRYTKEDHDSYKGYRSDYINLAISLDANFTESYNTIHLSPKVFEQFFSWWKLFSSNMQLPVRKGILFGETKKSTKFSKHLITNRFKFNLNSLYISHMYRDNNTENEADSEDKINCYGIRGKTNTFLVDLRQRKEKRILTKEGNSKNMAIMKMNFHIADVHLTGIDLRIINAMFAQNIYNAPTRNSEKEATEELKYHIFDKDMSWFDIEDYEEALLPSLANCKRTVHIYPLLYSDRFSYLRDTEPDIRFREVDLFNSGDQDTLHQVQQVFEAGARVTAERLRQLKDQVRYNKARNLPIDELLERIDLLNQTLGDIETEKKKNSNAERRLLVSNLTAKFNNKFILLRMFLKWNNKNRNLLLKYIHFVKMRRFFKKYLSFESISALEELIKSNEGFNDYINSEDLLRIKLSDKLSKKKENVESQSRLNNFDDILTSVASNESMVGDYLIEIISPQIQLQSDEVPDSAIIVTTPFIDAKIVSVYDKSKDRLLLNIDELETRVGCLIDNANVLIFDKSEVKSSKNCLFDKNKYGSIESWPPWVGIEIGKDASLAGENHVLLENTSVMLTYYESKPIKSVSRFTESSSESDNDSDSSESLNSEQYLDSSELVDTIKNRLRVDVPKVNITSTSSQYFTLYFMISDLLVYKEPNDKLLTEKLEKLKFSINFQDLDSLYEEVKVLHFQSRVLQFMEQNYSFRQDKLDNESLNNYLNIKLSQNDIANQLNLFLHSILTGDTHSRDNEKIPTTEWRINADEIILHILENDRTPILDISVSKGTFSRIVNEDDSNVNRIEVAMIQGFNLIDGAIYPSFIEPMKLNNYINDKNTPNLITVDWSMYSNVGGIKLIDNFEVKSLPLKLRMDEVTGDKLMKFLFKSDLDNIDESPLFKNENENSSPSDSSDDEDSVISPYQTKTMAHSHVFSHSVTQASSLDEEEEEQLEAMIYRAQKYMSINNLKIHPVELLLSIKLKGGYKRLLNVQDFHLLFPEIFIQKRFMSVLDVTMFLKKKLIKTILGHVGGLVKNKLKSHKNPLEYQRPVE